MDEQLKVRDYGLLAWLVIVVWVVGYDSWVLHTKDKKPHTHSTLSTWFYNAWTKPSKKQRRHWSGPLLLAFWVYLTAHLFRFIPKEWDLFRRFFD